MDHNSLISIVSLIIVLLFCLFSVFLLTVKTKKKLSNRLLAGFLIVTSIDISVFFYHDFIDFPIWVEMLRMRLSSFKDPLLFLYILSVIYSDFKLKPKHLLLAIPWLTIILILFPNFFMVGKNAQTAFVENYTNTFEFKIINNINNLLEIAYIIAQAYYLIRFRKLLLENYTGKEAFYNYHWLKQLIIFILIGQFLTIIKGYVRDSGQFDDATTNAFRLGLLIFVLFIGLWLIFKALIAPKLFRGIGVNLKLSKEIISEDQIDTSQIHCEEINKLKQIMETNEPFLDASLTINKLSRQLNMSSRELSVLINQELNQHFFDFINAYRIEKAKNILKDSSQKKLTVLEILYEVGFNSKSSFNTAFKKHTGTTPTNYRKTQ